MDGQWSLTFSPSSESLGSDDMTFVLCQQETDRGLGDFCVQCHAPVAVREKATTDGRNLEQLPQHLKDGTDHVRLVAFDLPLDERNLPPARLRLRLRIRAMDHDVLEELVERGLLDESIPGEIPTFTISGGERSMRFNGTTYEWEPKPARTLDCRTVACEFTPEASDCQ